MMRLAPDELARRLQPFFEAAGFWDAAFLGDRHAWFFAVLELLKPRVKRLGDFGAQGRFFFVETIEYDPDAVNKYLRGMAEHLAALDAAFTELAAFDAASLEAALRLVAEARGVKAASLIHASRVAVTGKTVSPGLFEVLALLGRKRVHERFLAASRLASAVSA
jgi:glutamyl/glutaminyl-tRNA synthetase